MPPRFQQIPKKRKSEHQASLAKLWDQRKTARNTSSSDSKDNVPEYVPNELSNFSADLPTDPPVIVFVD
jgi:hypothetical protein